VPELLLGALGGALVSALAASAYAWRRAAARHRRAEAIQVVVRRYALGDLSRPAPAYGDDELGDVARATETAVQNLGRRVNDLTRDRARMEAILASMVEGVLVVDGQGRLQLVNAAARWAVNRRAEFSGAN